MNTDQSIKSFSSMWQGVLRRLRRYKRIHWKTYLLCEHDMANVPVVASDAEIRLLQAGEEHLLLTVGPLKLDDINERLQDGVLCYVAILEERFAAYLWVKVQGQHDLVVTGKMLDILPGECWLYTAWVADWARNRKLYSAMSTHALRHLALRGCDKAWNEVEINNRGAKRALSHTGWKLVHRFRVIGIGPHVTTLQFDRNFRDRTVMGLED